MRVVSCERSRRMDTVANTFRIRPLENKSSDCERLGASVCVWFVLLYCAVLWVDGVMVCLCGVWLRVLCRSQANECCSRSLHPKILTSFQRAGKSSPPHFVTFNLSAEDYKPVSLVPLFP